MKILIMTGKFGMGHWSAATSLRDSMLRAIPGAEASVIDLFDWAAPDCADAIYRGSPLLVNHGSGLYNLYYKATGLARSKRQRQSVHPGADGQGGGADPGRNGPTASLPPIPYAPSSSPIIKGAEQRPAPGDLHHRLSVHRSGSTRGPTAIWWAARRCWTALGTGRPPPAFWSPASPVRPEFKLPRCGSSIRQRLLMMGGGGLLPRGKKFYDGLNACPASTTIITGNNRKLYDKLAGRWENITVLGYTDQVRDYMIRPT